MKKREYVIDYCIKFNFLSKILIFQTESGEIMKVPLLDLQGQYNNLKDEIIKEMIEICDSQRFILGPKVEKLEKEIA